jgi:hypothetical protein
MTEKILTAGQAAPDAIIPGPMPKLHPDSAAIDRIGVAIVSEHFYITRQAVHYWRRAGVPKRYRRMILALGEKLGIEVPEMRQMRDRISPAPASGQQPASSASPA